MYCKYLSFGRCGAEPQVSVNARSMSLDLVTSSGRKVCKELKYVIILQFYMYNKNRCYLFDDVAISNSDIFPPRFS